MVAPRIIRRVDDLGRIVIPKEIRRELKIKESDSLEIFTSKNGEIIMKPYRTNYPLRRSGDLEDLQGKIIAQGHRLDAEQILSAFGINFQVEEMEKD